MSLQPAFAGSAKMIWNYYSTPNTSRYRVCDTCHNFTDTPESESQRVDCAFLHQLIPRPKAQPKPGATFTAVKGKQLWLCPLAMPLRSLGLAGTSDNAETTAGQCRLLYQLFFSMVLSGIPSGKRLRNYGKSPFLIGKSTINGNFHQFSIAMLVYQRVPLEGYGFLHWNLLISIERLPSLCRGKILGSKACTVCTQWSHAWERNFHDRVMS